MLKLQYFGRLMQELTHFKRPWCRERLKAGGEGGDRGWDGWMASPTQWTWVWVDSGSWWWTGRPGVLWFTGSQRVRHNWVTDLNWIDPSLSLTQITNHDSSFTLAKNVMKLLLLHLPYPVLITPGTWHYTSKSQWAGGRQCMGVFSPLPPNNPSFVKDIWVLWGVPWWSSG